MRNFSFFAVILLLASLPACSSRPESRLWLYTNSSYDLAADPSLMTPTSFLELRPDGTYTQDFGRFDHGSWTLTDRKLSLVNQLHTTYVYRVNSLSRDKMDLLMGKTEVAHFDGHVLPSSKEAKDPYSFGNNQWRIRAVQKESDSAIRRRLFDHCRFWEVFFTWGVDKNENVDVREMPTPMKIYANGFGLKRYDDLPLEWRSYFFDDEDCHKADTLIKHTFRRTKIVWRETGSDYQKFISGFQQLEKALVQK